MMNKKHYESIQQLAKDWGVTVEDILYVIREYEFEERGEGLIVKEGRGKDQTWFIRKGLVEEIKSYLVPESSEYQMIKHNPKVFSTKD